MRVTAVGVWLLVALQVWQVYRAETDRFDAEQRVNEQQAAAEAHQRAEQKKLDAEIERMADILELPVNSGDLPISQDLCDGLKAVAAEQQANGGTPDPLPASCR